MIINEEEKKVIVGDNVSIEELAQILDKYSNEYKIYIGDEFNEDTNIKGWVYLPK